MFELVDERIPIKVWADTVDPEALRQARNLANLPWAHHHIALMPDVHVGFGMPIGGVLATIGVVIPNAVGVDIGCGMNAVRTSLEHIDRSVLQKIFNDLHHAIPVGHNHHQDPQVWSGFDDAPDIPVVQRELDSARYQLGTLGGGNHFIEIRKGDDGYIWIMLHSGSRNFGYTIAKEFYHIAKEEAGRKKLDLPDIQLAPLPLEESEITDACRGRGAFNNLHGSSDSPGNQYLQAMGFAQDFAASSRAHMLQRVREILGRHFPRISFDDEVNIHHNFASVEEHFGRKVIVHRKGATSARRGERGIIPGSQGTRSYIVEGLGNPDSFESCSHGAGRVMGRKEAQKKLDLNREQSLMDRQGILHDLRRVKDLDEAAGAYKNIGSVMKHQRDLVKILVELTPLAVRKG